MIGYAGNDRDCRRERAYCRSLCCVYTERRSRARGHKLPSFSLLSHFDSGTSAQNVSCSRLGKLPGILVKSVLSAGDVTVRGARFANFLVPGSVIPVEFRSDRGSAFS